MLLIAWSNSMTCWTIQCLFSALLLKSFSNCVPKWRKKSNWASSFFLVKEKLLDLNKIAEKKIIKIEQNQQIVQSIFQENRIRKISGDVQTKTKIIWKERSREHTAETLHKMDVVSAFFDGLLDAVKIIITKHVNA